MQSLTSCQCSVCHECFKLHFTIAVRDKHIRDMVCPGCGEPDINDPEQLDSYFSTLDIQVPSVKSPSLPKATVRDKRSPVAVTSRGESESEEGSRCTRLNVT